MNFTREPIILSVISPKEGSKLVLRNTMGGGQEDFFVDAVEIVSFANGIFYRSLERPKSFLLPISSYEVLEIKETRMVLKSVDAEKSIKIGPGSKPSEEGRIDKSKMRKKRRKPLPQVIKTSEPEIKEKGGDTEDETTHVSSSVLKKLFPPPNTLIKEKLKRFKSEEFFEENILPSVEEEKPSEEDLPQKEDVPSEEKEKEPKKEDVKESEEKKKEKK